MTLSTGDRVLDEALRGGLPRGEAALVTGGPGTGKSTLAMQFLQEGVERGEESLYITTEQTIDGLKDAFSEFAFDVDHEKLTITSVHATPGYTLNSNEETLTLSTVDNGDGLDESVPAPFRSRFVKDHLERYAPCDRIVLDSISGLRPMADEDVVFRREVMDLVQLFGSKFDATSLLVSEHADSVRDRTASVGPDPLQFSAHGVIALWQEAIDGDRHRFLAIRKLRGVDHDRREFAFSIDGSGVSVRSRQRPRRSISGSTRTLETGIDGLDDLCGGGLVRGGPNVLERDGEADVTPLLASLCSTAIERDEAVCLLPGADFEWGYLEDYTGDRDVEDLLSDDRLFVVDPFDAVESDHRNVLRPGRDDDLVALLDGLRTDLGDRPLVSVIDVDAFHRVTATGRESVRADGRAKFTRSGDATIYVLNPAIVESRLAASYVNAARQVIRTWLRASGLQVVKLEKSPLGRLGGTKLVEYTDEPPYVRLE